MNFHKLYHNVLHIKKTLTLKNVDNMHVIIIILKLRFKN